MCHQELISSHKRYLFFKEKGTTPLHVAAQAGQVLQVELLLVYGANPNEEDQQGRTPAYYARYVNPLTSVFDCLPSNYFWSS